MRKFISPVMIKWIRVATLLLVFVVFLHSSKDGKNRESGPITLVVMSDSVRFSTTEALQVDEPLETETAGIHSYVLPAIAIGRLRLKVY